MTNCLFDDLRRGSFYDIAVMSAIGKRESQQDAAYIAATDEDVFAVVCDGMGGDSAYSECPVIKKLFVPISCIM